MSTHFAAAVALLFLREVAQCPSAVPQIWHSRNPLVATTVLRGYAGMRLSRQIMPSHVESYVAQPGFVWAYPLDKQQLIAEQKSDPAERVYGWVADGQRHAADDIECSRKELRFCSARFESLFLNDGILSF